MHGRTTVDVQENPNLEEIISDFLGTPIFGMPLILWLILLVGFPVILYMLYKSGPLWKRIPPYPENYTSLPLDYI